MIIFFQVFFFFYFFRMQRSRRIVDETLNKKFLNALLTKMYIVSKIGDFMSSQQKVIQGFVFFFFEKSEKKSGPYFDEPLNNFFIATSWVTKDTAIDRSYGGEHLKIFSWKICRRVAEKNAFLWWKIWLFFGPKIDQTQIDDFQWQITGKARDHWKWMVADLNYRHKWAGNPIRPITSRKRPVLWSALRQINPFKVAPLILALLLCGNFRYLWY